MKGYWRLVMFSMRVNRIAHNSRQQLNWKLKEEFVHFLVTKYM